MDPPARAPPTGAQSLQHAVQEQATSTVATQTSPLSQSTLPTEASRLAPATHSHTVHPHKLPHHENDDTDEDIDDSARNAQDFPLIAPVTRGHVESRIQSLEAVIKATPSSAREVEPFALGLTSVLSTDMRNNSNPTSPRSEAGTIHAATNPARKVGIVERSVERFAAPSESRSDVIDRDPARFIPTPSHSPDATLQTSSNPDAAVDSDKPQNVHPSEKPEGIAQPDHPPPNNSLDSKPAEVTTQVSTADTRKDASPQKSDYVTSTQEGDESSVASTAVGTDVQQGEDAPGSTSSNADQKNTANATSVDTSAQSLEADDSPELREEKPSDTHEVTPDHVLRSEDGNLVRNIASEEASVTHSNAVDTLEATTQPSRPTALAAPGMMADASDTVATAEGGINSTVGEIDVNTTSKSETSSRENHMTGAAPDDDETEPNRAVSDVPPLAPVLPEMPAHQNELSSAEPNAISETENATEATLPTPDSANAKSTVANTQEKHRNKGIKSLPSPPAFPMPPDLNDEVPDIAPGALETASVAGPTADKAPDATVEQTPATEPLRDEDTVGTTIASEAHVSGTSDSMDSNYATLNPEKPGDETPSEEMASKRTPAKTSSSTEVAETKLPSAEEVGGEDPAVTVVSTAPAAAPRVSETSTPKVVASAASDTEDSVSTTRSSPSPAEAEPTSATSAIEELARDESALESSVAVSGAVVSSATVSSASANPSLSAEATEPEPEATAEANDTHDVAESGEDRAKTTQDLGPEETLNTKNVNTKQPSMAIPNVQKGTRNATPIRQRTLSPSRIPSPTSAMVRSSARSSIGRSTRSHQTVPTVKPKAAELMASADGATDGSHLARGSDFPSAASPHKIGTLRKKKSLGTGPVDESTATVTGRPGGAAAQPRIAVSPKTPQRGLVRKPATPTDQTPVRSLFAEAQTTPPSSNGTHGPKTTPTHSGVSAGLSSDTRPRPLAAAASRAVATDRVAPQYVASRRAPSIGQPRGTKIEVREVVGDNPMIPNTARRTSVSSMSDSEKPLGLPTGRRTRSFTARRMPDFKALHEKLPPTARAGHVGRSQSARPSPRVGSMATPDDILRSIPQSPSLYARRSLSNLTAASIHSLTSERTDFSASVTHELDASENGTVSPTRQRPPRSKVTTPKPFRMPGDRFHELARAELEEKRRESDNVDTMPRVYKARAMPDFSRDPRIQP